MGNTTNGGTMKQKTVADIVKQFKRNQNNKANCALLIGAGCSVQAGIRQTGGNYVFEGLA